MSAALPLYALIRAAVIARVRAEVPGFATVEAYAGQMDVSSTDQLTVVTPACLVVFERDDVSGRDSHTYMSTCKMSAVVFDANEAREAARVDALVGGVQAALAGFTPITGGGQIQLGSTSLVFNDRSVIAYAVEFTCYGEVEITD